MVNMCDDQSINMDSIGSCNTLCTLKWKKLPCIQGVIGQYLEVVLDKLPGHHAPRCFMSTTGKPLRVQNSRISVFGGAVSDV